MSTNDYVKFITQTFVKHFDQPVAERREQRSIRKDQRPSLLFQWFGVIPYAFIMMFKKKKV
ncbi:YqzE family protein [Falsibacillus pallidus]|uniref:YqzE-like protein n=1 Tax=Falsibacillus pallidus TaxID=493781 RepID=A0A370GBL5_9BACI|nr:YqzE family protein [Falsibacillus pallidus]RDI41168.1 YqzE-like protein [Falsibacillus pallidus]